MNSNDNSTKEAFSIVRIFVISIFACYLYSIFTKKYSGDYLFQEVTLNNLFLTIILFLNLIPYFILWFVYKKFKKSQPILQIKISFELMLALTILLFIYTFIVINIYGVGKMEADVYESPSYIKPFIQIMNRINFVYVVLFFILLSKSFIYDVLGIVMILVISYLTAGMGSILYIIFIVLIKYYSYLLFFYKKNKALIILIILLSPFAVSQLYNLRDQLRNSETKETTTTDLIFGKLAGRLSSFSNSAVIIQEPLYFVIATSSLDNFYYQKQAWRALVGGDYREQKPEYLMKGVFNDGINGDINSAFMTSTPGNLILAFFKSPLNCVLNILNIFSFIYLIFKLGSFLKTKYSLEFSLVLVIYPITSGVSSEYVIIITTLIFLFFFNAFFHLLFFTNTNRVNI
jgi:hypothetical protein